MLINNWIVPFVDRHYVFLKNNYPKTIMKRYLLSFLLCLSFCTSFAQDGKGSINIVAFPEGVTITFLGEEYKNTVDRQSISVGKYKAMFHKAGFVPVDTMLEVKEGITKYYNIVLSQKKSETSASSVSKKPVKHNKKSEMQVRYYAIGQAILQKAYSQSGMFGVTFNGDGFYIKGVKSILGKQKNGCYPGGDDAKLDDYNYIYAEALAGYLHEFNKNLAGYAGVGYGKRRVFQKYTNDEYYYSPSDFVDGAAVDVGLIGRFGVFCLSAGVNTINFNTFALCVGVGLTF